MMLARSSVVEHYLDMVGVASSILVEPTIHHSESLDMATGWPPRALSIVHDSRWVSMGPSIIAGPHEGRFPRACVFPECSVRVPKLLPPWLHVFEFTE